MKVYNKDIKYFFLIFFFLISLSDERPSDW